MNTIRRAFSWASWAVVKRVVSMTVLVAGVLALAGAGWWALAGRDDPGATLAGFRPYLIATGSMSPTYRVNGLVLTRHTPIDDVREGTVVAFQDSAGHVITHRAVQVDRAYGSVTRIVVKGDNNPVADVAPVTGENYLGTVVAHTNVTASIWHQFQAQGTLRIVLLPLAGLGLLWISWRTLHSARQSRTGQAIVALGLLTVFLGAGTAVYGRYVDQKHQHINATLTGAADQFHSSPTAQVRVENHVVIGTIAIPALDLYYPLVPHHASASLDVGVGHHAGPAPNEAGNTVLVGNRSWGNLFFARLHRLRAGDVVVVTGLDRQTVYYVVTGHRSLGARDKSYLAQPTDGSRQITLVAKGYDGRSHYVVTAVPATDQRAAATAAVIPHVSDHLMPGGAVPAAIAVGGLLVVGLAANGVITRRRRDRPAGDPHPDVQPRP